MKKTLKKILGDPQAKTLKRLKKRVQDINALEKKYEKLTDAKLKVASKDLKKKVDDGKDLDKLLPDAFALVKESAWRVLKMKHFDVQLIGGMVLHEGKVAEMKTGEGKTLTATLAMYLNGLSGKGAHLVTVNEYLAQRDAGWMGQLYDFLGLSTAVIVADQSFIYDKNFVNEDHQDKRLKHLKPCTRQEAYAADITYGTNNEFGFDYLRDNMVRETSQLRQRELNFAIVDEVDSILIDEARTPLIISAPSVTSGTSYQQFAKVAVQLKRDKDYEVDEKQKSVVLTDDGVEHVEKILGIDSLYTTDNIRTIFHLEQALRAEGLFTRDKDYVVTKDGEVVIVDEFTGRLLAGRRYNEGLHQAIEAKEGVEVQEESMTLATISFQNYFRLYEKLSGMTGTAETESEEFHQIYKLDVVIVPSNRPLVRDDKTDKIYRSDKGKTKAIVETVKDLQEKGQPVLIGTVSVEKNEQLSRALKKAGVKHEVLNAKNNEREAAIVANAGEKGSVTLATNIAGRGTDIVLGKGVKEVGGLFVLGSERHESRRIDNQLRGRAGRQGDPGASQFFVSTEDDLMRVFGGDRIATIMDRLGVDDDTPIENKVISKSLESAQKKVEGFNFDIRKNVVKYDDVMNRHRKATYVQRREILTKDNITKRIKKFIEAEAKAIAKSPDLLSDKLEDIVTHVFPLDEKTLDKLFEVDASKFEEELKKTALKAYEERTEEFGEEIMQRIERDIYLQLLDNLWMQHLESMDHLRQGIQWIGVGQRDPLVEYRRQSQAMFESMQEQLRHDIVKSLFRVEPVADERPVETDLTRAARHSVDNADEIVEGDEFQETDFVPATVEKTQETKKKAKKKKSRKKERQRRKKARRRRK